MDIDIDVIVKIIIPIIGTLMTYILVPLIKEKTSKEQRDNIYSWVKLAVAAAEMIYTEKGQGILKKEYVVDFLISKGIDVTLEDLDVLIEAAVAELKLAKNELSTN